MDVNAYWLERGKHYYEEVRLQSPYYKDQEQVFLSIVGSLSPTQVLELGCGFGRVTKVLADAMPLTSFIGIDLSQDQINNAKKHCKGLDNVRFCSGDVCTPELEIKDFDVVVCAELFLHLKHEPLVKLIGRILPGTKYLVHETWERAEVTASHCSFHDYHRIYSDLSAPYWSMSSRGHNLVVARGSC